MSEFLSIQPEYVLVHTGHEDDLITMQEKCLTLLKNYNEENKTAFHLVGIWSENTFIPLDKDVRATRMLDEFDWLNDAPSLAIFKVTHNYMDLIYDLFIGEWLYCQSLGILSMCYNTEKKALLVDMDSP